MNPTSTPVSGRTVAAITGVAVLLIIAAAVVTAGTATGPAIVWLSAIGVVALLAVTVRGGPVGAFAVALVLLILIPARYRIAPLGAAGAPAVLIGMACLAAWIVSRLTGWPRTGPQSAYLRGALLLVTMSTLASYMVAVASPQDTVEARAADRGLITLFSSLGLCLLAAGVITTRRHMRRCIAALAGSVAVVALLGVLQFSVGLDIAALLKPPGFTFAAVDYEQERSGFARIVSTASHPIELAVVLTTILPLTAWLFFTSTGKVRWLWAAALVVTVSAVPMTVARTGIAGLAVALIVLFPTWSWGRRVRVLIAGVVGLLVLRVAIPGLLGTLRAFFLQSENDPSILSREWGQERAFELVWERPLLGRGFGTLLPERYGFLDNQVLLTAVETGLLGLLAFIVLFGFSAGAALRSRRMASGDHRDHDRQLAASLLAALAAAAFSWLVFDALSFPISRALAFVVIGLVAAQWRMVLGEARRGGRSGRHSSPQPVPPMGDDHMPHMKPGRHAALSSLSGEDRL